MHRSRRVAALCVAAMMALPVSAATISGSTTGVAGADVNIGFGEVMIAPGELVTNQFEGLGVVMTPGLRQFTNNPRRGNFSSPYLGNFEFAQGGGITNFDPFSFLFTSVVTDASFAMSNNQGALTRFTALLDGVIVDSFTANVAMAGSTILNNFYGFNGIRFNEISVDVLGNSGRTAGIDTLAFNVAAVPLPASLPLLFAGLGGLAMLRRRQRHAQA